MLIGDAAAGRRPQIAEHQVEGGETTDAVAVIHGGDAAVEALSLIHIYAGGAGQAERAHRAGRRL